MAGTPLRKFAYLIGGAIAAVALVGTVGSAFLYWPEWRREQQVRATVREDTRTHDRPLSPKDDDENTIESAASKALVPVRAPNGGSDDVLSFVSMPSFHDWRAVSITLSPGSAMAQGKIVGIQQDGYRSPLRFSKVTTFTAPRAAFVQTAGRFDQLTDSWPGSEGDLCYDGTPVAFERIRARRVTSGWGTVECDKHYAEVRQIVVAFLRRYAPDPDLTPPQTEATWKP